MARKTNFPRIKRSKAIKPALTAEGEAFKLKLKALRVAADDAQEAVEAHEAQCPHQVYNNDDHAFCAVCGFGFGWHCEKSPDHVCHYYSHYKDRTKVKMIDGSFADNPPAMPLPDPEEQDPDWVYNAKLENDDECLFCGYPNERK